MAAGWASPCNVLLALLLLVPATLQLRDEETCFADGSLSCSLDQTHAALPVDSIQGRVPHKISAVDTSDIHISVKTATKYHEERLSLLLLTWLQTLEPQQVHIVTDDVPDDRWTATAEKYGFQVARATGCTTGHCRDCLCCKSGAEFEQYYTEREASASHHYHKWFCHVDDDVYVNIRQLVRLLLSYDLQKEHVYLGRWSLNRDTKIKLTHYRTENFPSLKSKEFAFGTGALYCISPLLMTELEPYLRGSSQFTSTCQLLRYTDDMTIGVVIEAILGYNFTDVDLIYSQIHALNTIPASQLPSIISISHGQITLPSGEIKKRRVSIPNSKFSTDQDPTRFLSYHCLIHPNTSWCRHTEWDKQ